MAVSGGERAAIIGDLARTPAHVYEMYWPFVGDVEPQLSAQTRAKLLDGVEARPGRAGAEGRRFRPRGAAFPARGSPP